MVRRVKSETKKLRKSRADDSESSLDPCNAHDGNRCCPVITTLLIFKTNLN